MRKTSVVKVGNQLTKTKRIASKVSEIQQVKEDRSCSGIGHVFEPMKLFNDNFMCRYDFTFA